MTSNVTLNKFLKFTYTEGVAWAIVQQLKVTRFFDISTIHNS